MVNRSGVGPAFARSRGLILLVLLLTGCAFLLKHDAVSPSHSSAKPATPQAIQAALTRLPLSFEPNQGQTDAPVKFLAHGNGYGLYLLSSEAVLTFPQRTKSGLQDGTVEMQLGGADPQALVAGADRLPGHSNYFIGSDSSRWRRNIPQFARVRYRDVYPGIDLSFYGNQSRLEYDFEVSPGADAKQIELNFKGAEKVNVAPNGDLVLDLNGRELHFQAPHIYQRSSTGDQTIAGSFVLRGKDSAGFTVGPYDRSRTLVIDPVITFSSYLGGAGDESCTVITGASAGFVPHCPSVTVDSSGAIYVAGATTTPNTGTFSGSTPILIGAMATADVFVARITLSSAGPSLSHVTYIGGSSGIQYPTGVAVDSGFAMYVAGTTNAPDFPTTPSGLQTTPASAGNNHGFITKLDNTGSLNVYSTYLSGNGVDTIAGMAIDPSNRVYVIGTTTSSDFPVTVGALQSTPNATNQFFFTKIDPAQNTARSLLYSTYIGGSTPSNGIVTGGAIAVDTSFNVYLAGGTNFTDMGAPNPWILNALATSGGTESGGIDVWAAKLNAPPTSTQQYTLAYGTYLGGSGDDIAYGVATDGTDTYITGSTTSTTITQLSSTTTTTLAYQTTNAGGGDAFVAKFGVPAVVGTTQGTLPLDYFSFLGGTALDVGLGITADTLGNARVVGLTASTNFPTTAPFQSAYGGGATDGFVARLNTTNTTTTTNVNTSTASFLGGSGTDIATSIALDTALNTYVAGETSSPNFPTASPLPSGGTLSGGTDAFVTEVGPNTSGLTMPQVTAATALPACNAANPTVSPSPAGVGNPITFTYYIYNTSDPVSQVSFNDNLGVNSGSTSATTSQGSCGAAVTSGTLTCSLGTVNTSTITTLTTPNTCNASTSVNYASTVTVTVTAPVPTTPQTSPQSVGNSASLTFPGGTLATISGAVPVNDYSLSAALTPPSTSSTIPSGGQVNYAITVTPTGSGFSESVSLACGAGVPSGATCTFTNNPIPNMSNGPQSRTLAISTTARVTTTTGSLFRHGRIYALWLPILGIGIMGAGVSRKRRMLLGIFFVLVLGATLLQAGCSSTSSTTTTTGTPAGTYTVVINATSGSAVRSTTVQFTVQ